MKDMRISKRLILSFLGLLLAVTGVNGQTLSARAEASPGTVMVGESAQYIVRFSGTTQIPNLNPPRVDGLDFSNNMGTSTFQQIINGRVSIETRAIWNFSPVRTGTFTIPGRTVRISGNDVRIPAVRVEAIPMDEETRSRTLLQLDIPEGPFFVGQAIPARLGLFLRNDISLSNVSLPEINGDAFIHTEFDRNPARTGTRINGRVYEAFVWDFILTPIKTGSTEFAFSQRIEIQVPSRDNRTPSIFSFTRTRSESVTLSADTVSTEVLPLPRENQPDSFNGAIGDFTVTAALSSRELMVGEPINLTLSISGTGNFDRIAPPELSDWENWRVYPPKVEFEPEDESGYKGVKSFEFILIPQNEAITEVPGMRYATFDPESAEYETTVLDPEPVTVAPSDRTVSRDSYMPASDPDEEKAIRIPESLLPIRPNPGNLQSQGSLGSKPVFWIINLSVALVILSAGAWLRRKSRLRSDQRLAQRHFGTRQIRKSLEAARKAARDNDARAFFALARYAIQERASHFLKSPVDAKTLVTSDCLSILQQTNLSEDSLRECTLILNAADTCQFAGSVPDHDALEGLHANLVNVITEMNRIRE